jgi:hypothetical protein
MSSIEKIQNQTAILYSQLINHPLYKNISSIEDVRTFMEIHVFSVWDFMSILKTLQIHLTCTNIPWVPSKDKESRRLINEITLCEESDMIGNTTMSHYEMYIEAMQQANASTQTIESIVMKLQNGYTYKEAFSNLAIKKEVKEFVDFTFEVINSNKIHLVAALFTFTRENLIPDMFIQIVNKINDNENIKLDKLVQYLDRHIEVDGDTHGPMAIKMIKELCDNDEKKWKEAQEIVDIGLEKRIKLWDCINNEIQKVKH